MSARETAELLLLVGRLVQSDGYEGELSPAQIQDSGAEGRLMLPLSDVSVPQEMPPTAAPTPTATGLDAAIAPSENSCTLSGKHRP
jgi:hypothetical protein